MRTRDTWHAGAPRPVARSAQLGATAAAAMADAGDCEVDFIRYFGLASGEGEQKDARVQVGAGNLGLRPDASLLALSNRYGVLFAGTPDGLRWSRVDALRACARRGGVGESDASIFNHDAFGAPFALALNSDETLLAAVTAGEQPQLRLYDVAALVGGGDGPLHTHSFRGASPLDDVQAHARAHTHPGSLYPPPPPRTARAHDR